MHAVAEAESLRVAATGNAIVDMLDEAELFAGFAWPELELIARHVTALEADAGCTLFAEGAPGDRLYVLVRGRVQTWKQDVLQPRTVIATDGAGKSLGEMALIDGEPRSAACTVLAPSLLLSLTRESFERLARAHPAIAFRVLMRIARLMSRRLRSTSGRLAEHLGKLAG
ncbi:MAG: cyclic nucleotide-binding domain-containing protein [Betaproteobacteria bacterium]|jgi:CRP/FNR family cyclic AMP-dependent transcriptional regulator|nr:cyclic nucleotide-binding domain-containing protein [Betaproteobacteria bacterium]